MGKAVELRDLSMQGVDIDTLAFDIDIGSMEDGVPDVGGTEEKAGEKTKGKPWTTRGVRCDMKPCLAAREKNGHRYVSLFASSKEGMTLEEIKNSPKCEEQMAAALIRHLRESLGTNLAECGWAMMTTGRRRHREGYHFATAVSSVAAKELGIPFREDVIRCANADRLKPALTIEAEPEEKNLILFDDIITTGTTMSRTADLLMERGKTVLIVIGIRNQ